MEIWKELMIRNYFKIAWRNLKKNRFYAFVNITGLTVGMVSCLLIGIYIAHELSYDRFHQNADNIVRVSMSYNFGGNTRNVAVTGTKVGPQFKRIFPQVVDYVRILKSSAIVSYGNKVLREKNVLYADPSFFKIFSFNLINGDVATALGDPSKIVISQTAAKKYFNTDDVVGKALKFGDKIYSIAAVADNVASYSQIQFDFLLPFV